MKAREELVSQITHDALAEQAGEQCLAIRRGKRECQRRAKQHRHAARCRDVARRQCDIDHTLRKQRSDKLQQALDRQQAQRRRDEQSIRPSITNQPAH